MKKKNTVRVGWKFGGKNIVIDFGLFKAHPKNTIVVDKNMWTYYVSVRRQFEEAHKELTKLIK